MTDLTLKALEKRRRGLLRELAQTGDMRRGSISENYRRCGKPRCRCVAPGDPGHGPYYAFTRKVHGKTQTLNLRPGARLARIQTEVETYRHFRQICQRLVELNEQICKARPLHDQQDPHGRASVKKKSRRW